MQNPADVKLKLETQNTKKKIKEEERKLAEEEKKQEDSQAKIQELLAKKSSLEKGDVPSSPVTSSDKCCVEDSVRADRCLIDKEGQFQDAL